LSVHESVSISGFAPRLAPTTKLSSDEVTDSAATPATILRTGVDSTTSPATVLRAGGPTRNIGEGGAAAAATVRRDVVAPERGAAAPRRIRGG